MNTNKRENVLVTGGGGYIGSHTCKELYHSGYQPVTYDNLSKGHKWAIKWGPLEIGDIRDEKRLLEVIDRYKPTAVMHFAAYAYVGESIESPEIYYDNNVIGSINLLKVLREKKIKKIIFSSSCATYGIPIDIPIGENHPNKPINPYGHTKLIIEQTLNDFDHAYDIKFVSLRYFNAAGADIDCEIGELHDPETHLIPIIINSVINNTKEPVNIFGSDYETADGTCIRDYIHVSDLAMAHVKALEYLENNNNSIILNLGTGSGYSVREIINSVEKIINKKIKTKIKGRRIGDPPVLVASSEKAKRILNWKANQSNISNIIKTALKWHEKTNPQQTFKC